VTVARNSSSGSSAAVLVLWDALSGEAMTAPIPQWWSSSDYPAGVAVEVDVAASFGDYFLHEDGIVYFMLFASNTATPRSQVLQQWSVYGAAPGSKGPSGWHAPQLQGSCMVTPASTPGYPAMSSMTVLSSLGSFIGFTDFELQGPSAASNASSVLGLASVWWNSPTCFQWPLKTFAQGLAFPVPLASANAIHQASNTLAYLSLNEQTEEAGMVLMDVSSPVRATELPVQGQKSVSLKELNATRADFRPAMVPVEVGKGAAQAQASFVVVQSSQTSPSSTPPPAVLAFDATQGFHAPQVPSSSRSGAAAAPVGYFPPGPAAALQGVDQFTGEQVDLMVALDPAGPGTGALFAAPSLAQPWALQGKALPDGLEATGQQLAFIPASIVGSGGGGDAKKAQPKPKPEVVPPHSARKLPHSRHHRAPVVGEKAHRVAEQ